MIPLVSWLLWCVAVWLFCTLLTVRMQQYDARQDRLDLQGSLDVVLDWWGETCKELTAERARTAELRARLDRHGTARVELLGKLEQTQRERDAFIASRARLEARVLELEGKRR